MQVRASIRLATALGLLAGLGLATETQAAVSSSVRISEVYARPSIVLSGLQKVEIANFGEEPADISGWRFWHAYRFKEIPAGTVLGAGEVFIVHVSANGVSDSQNLYTGQGDPILNPNWDTVALFLPGANFQEPGDMVDFVQWGSANGHLSELASQAGLWIPSEYCHAVNSKGVSLQYCDPLAFGASCWEHDLQTIGKLNDCQLPPTPVEVSTWGSIKNRFGP